MANTFPNRFRVAAIGFLNPAPLLYDFNHDPAAAALRNRYDLRYTSPAQCAAQLASGEADLGLVPIGALPFLPQLAAVPGCTIASLRAVRSIQLVVRPGLRLQDIRTLAVDSASRSSTAYALTLLRAFYGTDPVLTAAPADLSAMLQEADAALLIGDPALVALYRCESEGVLRDHTWHDVATLWHHHTGLPWVAAVWAVLPEALTRTAVTPAQLVEDLSRSRDAGLRQVETLVQDWRSRIAVPPSMIRAYLTENIHYYLDDDCLRAIDRFYTLTAETGVLPPYRLHLLET